MYVTVQQAARCRSQAAWWWLREHQRSSQVWRSRQSKVK